MIVGPAAVLHVRGTRDGAFTGHPKRRSGETPQSYAGTDMERLAGARCVHSVVCDAASVDVALALALGDVDGIAVALALALGDVDGIAVAPALALGDVDGIAVAPALALGDVDGVAVAPALGLVAGITVGNKPAATSRARDRIVL